ncbi:MAG: acyl-CoA reductase [Cyclobacteriaceae bacterium]|nr:acyl-CoA reductase [Cyclobacteriaceae bacterium]UYN88305.1 MAG: acyl-CoA reductase [Cyclobacteriaceae bacterium]
MTPDQRINAFTALGHHLQNLNENTVDQLVMEAGQENPWFTQASIRKAIKGIVNYLDHKKLKQWLQDYNLQNSNPKTIALIMAGNIPLVGFHDLLCVLLSGHKALIKLSSKDSKLNRYLIERLIGIAPGFESHITIQTETLKGYDAVIATGSDNTARHFEYYFRNVPHLIRRNRTSCAILSGTETKNDFINLGYDVFDYFGLGCRNVSKLYIPVVYDFKPLLEAWKSFGPVIQHHKYANNYDYQKSILLVNQLPFLDTGFILLQESDKLVSPIAVLYYEQYSDDNSLKKALEASASKLQCVVGEKFPATIPFGKTQQPELWDYADGIDTMAFLSSIN